MKNIINIPVVEQVFQKVRTECTRSTTKGDLHSDADKEEILGLSVITAVKKYGENIADAFQSEFGKTDEKLSYLFAQLTNAIIEKTFRDGSCHAQASYSLFELAKKSVFDVSLVYSKTEKIKTEHFYLMMPDKFALNIFLQHDITSFIVNNSRFGSETILYDTWSDILCKWQDFSGEIEVTNQCTRVIKTSVQHLFRPLSLLYENEKMLLEKIIACLCEYKNRLLQLSNSPDKISAAQIGAIVANHQEDSEFINEIIFLNNNDECIKRLILNIDEYLADFTEQLNPGTGVVKQHESKLSNETTQFFNEKKITAEALAWKVYPAEKLTGCYAGHQIRFFNIPKDITSEQSAAFNSHLKEKGFAAKMAKTKAGLSSIIVDLNNSMLEKSSACP